MKPIRYAAMMLALCLIWAGYPHQAAAAGPTTNLRGVFEAMGAKVLWNQSTKSIDVTRGDVHLSFQLGSNQAVKNGTTVTMNQPITANSAGETQISVYAVYPLAKDAKREKHYLVKSGDTLWKISLAYGVTVSQLKQWNGLTSDMIYVGQHLATSDPYYVVKAGDSLYSIANQTQSTVQEIKQANRLSSNSLTIGQKLYIPPQPSVAQPNMFANSVFPLIDRTYEPFGNTYGDARSYAAGETSRVHEGNDIMAKSWVPIFSVEDGVVVRHGWSELGGWRLTVESSNGIAFYYAHMSGYANGIKNGATVKKGQLIGYVGSTGYGPAGTSGKFASHLHFTMYDTNVNPWKPIDPYMYLKWWENR